MVDAHAAREQFPSELEAGRQRVIDLEVSETKRLRAEEELQRVFDLSLDMLCVTGYDGSFRRLNPAFEITLGYSSDELLVSLIGDLIHPEDRASFLAEMRRFITGAPGAYLENRCRCKDGLYKWVEWRLVPVVEEELVYAVGRDVTERKHTERELRRRNEELVALNAVATTLGQSLDLGRLLNAALGKVLEMMAVDASCVFLLAPDQNADAMELVAHRGLSPEEVEEVTRSKVIQDLITQVSQSGEPLVQVEPSDNPQLSTRAGPLQALHTFVGVPIKSQDEVRGVLNAYCRTPRKLSSQEIQLLTAICHQINLAVERGWLLDEAAEIDILQELNRLRSELIANVSHEIRTPLGLIKIFCTTLLREDVVFDRETQREFLQDIESETDKLERIVDNLLDLSRMESGRLRLDRRLADIGQLAREVASNIEVLVVRHLCEYDFHPDPLMANIDVRRIEQVLRNLLTNAVKYSPSGGTITVRGRGNEWQVLIMVSDEGIGIPLQDLERVFERFYRVENEATQHVRGAGLGLPVCRGIVEAHGGRIWATSTLGKGSTFCFTIPVSAELAEA